MAKPWVSTRRFAPAEYPAAHLAGLYTIALGLELEMKRQQLKNLIKRTFSLQHQHVYASFIIFWGCSYQFHKNG